MYNPQQQHSRIIILLFLALCVASTFSISHNPRVSYSVIEPLSKDDDDSNFPGWVYYEGFPNNDCTKPTNIEEAYVRDRCVVVYEDDIPSYSQKWTCPSNTATETTYTDLECEDVDTVIGLGTDNQCATTDTPAGTISVRWKCTTSSDFPVPSSKEYAVGTYYNKTDNCESNYAIRKEVLRTNKCLVDAYLVNGVDTNSVYITSKLKRTLYEDDLCEDKVSSDSLSTSCADVDDDQEQGKSQKWRLAEEDDDKKKKR